MTQVIVGTKYQIVIPKEVRRKIKGLRPGVKVSVYKSGENALSVDLNPTDWMERNSGLMKDAWKGIDTTKYLKKLRSEWDRKY